MENPPPHPSFESEPSPEQSPLDSLPEALGYVETEDLTETAKAYVEAIRSGAETKSLAVQYLERGEAIADQSHDERARLGLQIRLALLRRAGGRAEAYHEDMEDAYVHALQMGFDGLAAILKAELG